MELLSNKNAIRWVSARHSLLFVLGMMSLWPQARSREDEEAAFRRLWNILHGCVVPRSLSYRIIRSLRFPGELPIFRIEGLPTCSH